MIEYTRHEILRAAILHEWDKFSCVNVKALLAKLRRDWPRILFTKGDVENVLMEDGFFMDRKDEWKVGKDLTRKTK